MANCPKCKHHLRLLDWKQKCPYCGANIVVYDLQERLMQDADKAEVQYYHFQKKIDRLKASFVGSKLAIVRIFTSLLPVFALLIPFANVTALPPLAEFSGNVGLITIYNMVDKLDINLIISLCSDAVYGRSITYMLISTLGVLLSIVIMFVHFLCLLIACSPKAKIRNHILDALYLASNIIAVVFVLILPKNDILSISLQYGAAIYFALVLLYVAIDHLVLKKGIPVTHKQCYVGAIPIEEYLKMVEDGVPQEELRKEMYERLAKRQQEKIATLDDAEKNAKDEPEEVSVSE